MSAARAVAARVDTARLGAALADLVRVSRRDAPLPLGASTLSALRTVAEHGPLRAGDLARHEGVAAPTLSRIVAGLDADGYIVRTPDPDDRRVAWLEVTAGGRQLLDACNGRVHSLLAPTDSPMIRPPHSTRHSTHLRR